MFSDALPSRYGRLDTSAISVMCIIIGDSKLDSLDVDEEYWISKELYFYSLVAITNGICLHALIDMVLTSIRASRELHKSYCHEQSLGRAEMSEQIARCIQGWQYNFVRLDFSFSDYFISISI
jgi:hypothetical protein